MKLVSKNQVATAQEMREIDQKTIEEFSIPGERLMEAAGKGAFEFIMKLWPECRSAVVFCGKGNNGGDGLVIARYLLQKRRKVLVLLLAKKQELKGDARRNLLRFLQIRGKVLEIENQEQLNHTPIPPDTDLIVDAIFGTGLEKEVSGLPAKAIELINNFRQSGKCKVLAVDIPSGINATNGKVMGTAVRADATATFGLAKLGHYCFPGAAHTGRLKVIDIGFPPSLTAQIKTKAMNAEEASAMLKPRRPDAHKGNNGHTLIFAGSPGKTGAAVMAGESALRAGAGLVTLGVPASLHDIFEIKTLEVMTEPVPDKKTRSFGQSSISQALKLMQGKKAIAIGPGIGTRKGVTEFCRKIVLAAKTPVVIDADGLNALAGQIQVLKKVRAPLILTPHPGEMARLCGLDISEIQGDRVAVAKKYAREWKVIIVLKGAATVVASPSGEAFINLSGNPAMASAGMGDILTGIIAGLLSQSYEPFKAAALGAFIHGKAGDLAAEEMGGVGIIASDLLKKIPAVQRLLQNQALGKYE